MKDIFAPYKIAKQLKEIRFNEPCLAYYDEYESIDYNITEDNVLLVCYNEKLFENDTEIISAPTWEQVFKWFRERGYFSSQYYVEGTTDFFFRIFNNGKLIYESSCLFKKHHYYDYLNYLALKLIELYGQRTNKK